MFKWVFDIWIADKIYLLLMLTVLIIMLVRFRSLEYNVRPLVFFVATHFAMELTSDYLNYATSIDNVFLYHIFAPVGYTILCVVFYRTFRDKSLRRLIVGSAIVYAMLALCYTLFWEPLDQINSLAFMTECIFMTYWCFLFFRQILRRDDNYRPEYDRLFWSILGLLIYFIGNFFVVGSINYFVYKNLRILIFEVYYAGYVFNYLLYATLGVACLVKFPEYTHD